MSIFASLAETEEDRHQTLYERLCAVTAPNRLLDLRFAKAFNIYRRYLDGLADAYEIAEGIITIKEIEYDPERDNAKIRIGAPQNVTGGLRYTDDLPAFTANPADTIKRLLPDDAEYQLNRNMVNGWPLYAFNYRGEEFTAPYEALAICRGIAFFIKDNPDVT